MVPEEAVMSDSKYEIDWSRCPDVERVEGKVSGKWIVRGTRILADGVIENAEGGVSLEELTTDVYPNLGVERAKRIIAYAHAHAPGLHV
jgi:uncharacterized protein (DUF433 family)